MIIIHLVLLWQVGNTIKARTASASTCPLVQQVGGKEEDSEWGSQMIQDYGFRIYNPTIGKFLSVDPLAPDYPWYTPYQFAGNKPIWCIDLEGLEPVPTTDGIIREYKVKPEQGPTQIAKDLRENYGMKNITFLDIVFENMHTFETKANISDIYDKTDPGYTEMNINTGNILKIPAKEVIEAKMAFEGDRNASTLDNYMYYLADQDAADLLLETFGGLYGRHSSGAGIKRWTKNKIEGSNKNDYEVLNYSDEEIKHHRLYQKMKSLQTPKDYPPSPVPPIQTMTQNGAWNHNWELTGSQIDNLPDGEIEVVDEVFREVRKIRFRVAADTTGIDTTITTETRQGTIIFNKSTRKNPISSSSGNIITTDEGKVKKPGN